VTGPGEPVSTLLCAAWATEADLPDTRPTLPAGVSWDELLIVASEILWALSGRQWSGDGDCEAVAELRRDENRCVGWSAASVPVFGVAARDYLPRPAAQGQRAVKLPHDEATDVSSVTVDGAAFTNWRQQGSWLRRTDGRGWHEAATVLITYRWGKPPPAGGVRAVIKLALELGKDAAGDSSCRLPKRVVSITRQGVSMALIDPARYLDKGKLGMPDIDQWLASVNPLAVAERGAVWSPDVPRAYPVP
jgi:hypothetical protein